MYGSATRMSTSGSDFGEDLDDFDGRTFPDVVDVGLEGQAEAGDGGGAESFALRGDLLGNVVRLSVVDLACRADQAGEFRCCTDDEPRIDGDAVTADPGTRSQDVDAGMVVRQPDDFPDVELRASR